MRLIYAKRVEVTVAGFSMLTSARLGHFEVKMAATPGDPVSMQHCDILDKIRDSQFESVKKVFLATGRGRRPDLPQSITLDNTILLQVSILKDEGGKSYDEAAEFLSRFFPDVPLKRLRYLVSFVKRHFDKAVTDKEKESFLHQRHNTTGVGPYLEDIGMTRRRLLTGMSLLENKLEEFKCCANDVIHFRLVRCVADLQDNTITFKPDMTHQLFGDQESIFGFKDLGVDLMYTAGKLIPYLRLNYTERVPPQGIDGVYADNVTKILTMEMAPGVLYNLDNFVNAVEKDASFRPHGDLLHSYTVHTGGQKRDFQIYKTEAVTASFREYHERLQTFILFFIDAASFIDIDDEKWMFYVLFEKYTLDGCVAYATVGYMTVYKYYAYPAKMRPRLSQFLILPPFQRHGHGAHLLQAFYDDMKSRPEVLDITVEDPSENFQRLRDYVDAKNCQQLTFFQPEYLMKGFSESMATEAQCKLKLSKRQARRVYEILRLKATDERDEAMYRQYRLDVKRRLNAPFQRSRRDFQKLEQALHADELAQTMSCMSPEQRHMLLEKSFREHVHLCRQVLDRLAAAS